MSPDDVPTPTEPDDDRPHRGFGRETVETIDLDDHPVYDTADITPLDTPDKEGHDYALTVYIAGLYGAGSDVYVEPHSWEADERLRRIVYTRAAKPADQIRLEPLPSETAYIGREHL